MENEEVQGIIQNDAKRTDRILIVLDRECVKFRFIGREGPAADSLPTPVVNERILIVLDRRYVKFRFI